MIKPVEESPIGLTSKLSWDQRRCDDIIAAINRYKKAGKRVPTQWISELCTLEHCIRLDFELDVKLPEEKMSD